MQVLVSTHMRVTYAKKGEQSNSLRVKSDKGSGHKPRPAAVSTCRLRLFYGDPPLQKKTRGFPPRVRPQEILKRFYREKTTQNASKCLSRRKHLQEKPPKLERFLRRKILRKPPAILKSPAAKQTNIFVRENNSHMFFTYSKK